MTTPTRAPSTTGAPPTTRQQPHHSQHTGAPSSPPSSPALRPLRADAEADDPAAGGAPVASPVVSPGIALGHVAVVLHGLVRARGGVTNTQRMLIEALLVRCYEYAPLPEDWEEAIEDNPWLGWYLLEQNKFASDVAKMSNGTLSSELSELEALGILRRGTGTNFRYVCIAPPDEWDAIVFDEAAAKARRSRVGAGRPNEGLSRPRPQRPPNPTVPIMERVTDIYERPFMDVLEMREGMQDYPEAPAATLEAMWRFIQFFQEQCDDRFDVAWLGDLYTVLTSGQWTVSVLKGIINRQLTNPRIRGHWGYLLKTVSKTPHLRTPTVKAEDHHENTTNSTHAATPSRPRGAPRSADRGGTGGGAFASFTGRQPQRRDGGRDGRDGRGERDAAAL